MSHFLGLHGSHWLQRLPMGLGQAWLETELSRAFPVCPGWLQPAGFPGSGVVLCDFSRAVSPDFTWPFTFSPPSRPPPRRNLWEHKLVSLRFPKQDLHKQPPPQSPDNQPKQSPPQSSDNQFDNQFLICRELQPSVNVS